MATEHRRIATVMQKIKELSDNYTVPSDACISYKVLFAKLKELHKDLQQHIYLEKDILFPKAVSMEKELLDHPA
jgi:regulator of cell morphogenesis and NO signaling